MAAPVVTMNVCGHSNPIEISKYDSIISSTELDMNIFLMKCEKEYEERKTTEEDYLAIEIAQRFTFLMHYNHCCLTVHLNPFQSKTVYTIPLPLSEDICILTQIYKTYKDLL